MSHIRTARRRLLPALAAAAAAALLLTSCASGRDAATGDDSASAERVDGGELAVYSRSITTLDPRQTHGAISRALADSLLDIDPETFEYKPWLATEWSVDDEQKEFTFTLRDGVTFSDGTALDAETVKVNFDAAQQQVEDGEGWYIRGLFDYYEGTEVVDDDTVVVRFSEPNPAFLPTIPTSFLSILSADSWDKTYEERQAGDFAGSGPYVIDSYTPNEQVTLERRDDYDWASDLSEHSGPASIETVTFSYVDEQSVRESALLAGEVQLAQNPTIEGAAQLEEQGYELYYRGQSGNPYSLVANFARPLTKDIAVRRALSKAIDRDTIQESITTDREPASTSTLTPETYGYADQSDLIEHDPEEANEILDEAGWTVGSDGIREKDGERLELTIVNWWEPQAIIDSLQLIKEQAAEVGIEISLVNEIGGGNTWSDGDADFLYNNATRADGGHALYSQYADRFLESTAYAKAEDVTEPGSNLSQILEDSFVEPDEDTRLDLLAQAQEIIVRDAVRIPVFDNINSESGYFAADPKLHGLRENTLSELVIYDAWLEQ